MFDVFYFGKKPNLFPHEKYAESIHAAARQSRTTHFWFLYGGNDYSEFDFDYEPPAWEADHTHIWPNQFMPNGEVYLAPRTNVLETPHYHTECHVTRLDHTGVWKRKGKLHYLSGVVDDSDPVFNWKPPKRSKDDNPKIYVFGSKYNRPEVDPVAVYVESDNFDDTVQVIYMTEQTVKLVQNKEFFTVLDDSVEFDFDYAWRPNPYVPPMEYRFGSRHYAAHTKSYLSYEVPVDNNVVPTNRKLVHYDTERFVELKINKDRFEVLKSDIDFEFDYSWIPHPHEPEPFIYVFGTKQYPPEIMPVLKYTVPGATKVKYVTDTTVKVIPDMSKWQVAEEAEGIEFDFDFEWLPHPHETEPFIYVFGTKQYPPEIMPVLKYTVPGATKVKYVTDTTVKVIPDMSKWRVSGDVEGIEFDFDFEWLPHPHETEPFIYVFGNQHWSGDRTATIEYVEEGATQRKYVTDVIAKLSTLDIFYVDKSNPQSAERFEELKAKYNNIQKIRYVNSMFDTIKRCAKKAKTPRFWVVSSEYDYSDFNFDWQPDPWQFNMIHVFPNKWNKFSDTYLISKSELERCHWVSEIKDYPTLNFVKNQTVEIYQPDDEIYYLDFNNIESEKQFNSLREKYNNVYKIRYSGSMSDMLRRAVMASTLGESEDDDFVWVVSSVCDYSEFDFGWRPDPWQKDLIHVFRSGLNKKGETFYVPLKVFNEQYEQHKNLKNFTAIHYNDEQKVKKFDIPVIEYEGDKLFNTVKGNVFSAPYVLFTNFKKPIGKYEDVISYWDSESRAIIAMDTAMSGSTVLVPRDLSVHLNKQLYDYPYIVNQPEEHRLSVNSPLDVVYISNGEPLETVLLERLKKVLRENGYKNRLHIVSGVNGRMQAYSTAAKLSETPWFFAVFAKLEIDENFDFNWQPDYLQLNKHYIFSAKNVVNGLEYGHQALLAYNVDLLLGTEDIGLDVTLSSEHEFVPIHSGVAVYNQNEFMTWRTAFREVLKLKYALDKQYSVETEFRLKKWQTCIEGVAHGEWSVKGANDALKYYEEVNGDLDKLFNSFEWDWLKKRFEMS